MKYSIYRSRNNLVNYTNSINDARKILQSLVDKGNTNAYIHYESEAVKEFKPQVEMHHKPDTTIIKPASERPISDVLNHLRLEELMDKQVTGEPMSIDEIREMDMLSFHLYSE